MKFWRSGFQYSAGEIYVGYSKEQLEEFGAPSFDPRRGQVLAPSPVETSVIEAGDLPMYVDAVDPTRHVGKPIHDAELDRRYTIFPAEMAVYKQRRWPLPRKHFVSRLTELVRLSNSPHTQPATCGSCQQAIVTYRNFSFPEHTVYCNACYLKFLETR